MKLKFVLASILIGLVLSLGLGEMILRVIYDDLPGSDWEKALFCRNASLNYRFMRPNVSGLQTIMEVPGGVSVKANSTGYRDDDWSSPRRKGKRAVLMLGDSFGWGWGCPQDSMASSLLGGLRKELSVYNLCIPGDDMYKEYLRYRFHAKEVGADHLVILCYVNDFFGPDTQEMTIGRSRKEGLFEKYVPGGVQCDTYYSDDYKSYLKKSYLFRYLNNARLSLRNIGSGLGVKTGFMDSLTREGYASDVKFFSDTSFQGKASRLYHSLLSEMSADRKVTVVHIPPIYQVDAEKREQLARLFPGQAIDVSRLPALLRHAVDGLPNVRLVDPSEVFLSEQKKSPMYFQFDGHLNPRGHALLARVIAENLEL